MKWGEAKTRFQFLAEALTGSGGFKPQVTWADETLPDKSTRRMPVSVAPCYLVPYQRESPKKFAGRAALAVYENHLFDAVDRFVGFLMRQRPRREGVDGPLAEVFLRDADMRGTSLDAFLADFAFQAKARGSMLLLIDELPPEVAADGSPVQQTLATRRATRRIPYLRALPPEEVDSWSMDPATGLFRWVRVPDVHEVDGREVSVLREWNETGWRLLHGDEVLLEGAHAFGACPVLAFTESGALFPVVGRYAQIADRSRDLFNLESEHRELLRSQTFSLLTLQVTEAQAASFNAAETAAVIGLHSMLVHQGDTPAYVAPADGPIKAFEAAIARGEQAIDRICKRASTADADTGVESGVARRLRFESLNAELAGFAHRMQELELRMWALFSQAVGTAQRATSSWPTDFNLVDVSAELEVLSLMQATGFPPAALVAKRKAVAGMEFDSADEATKAAIVKELDDQAAAQAEPSDPEPGPQPGATQQ